MLKKEKRIFIFLPSTDWRNPTSLVYWNSYSLPSLQFSNERVTVFKKLRNIDESILIKNHSDISKVLPLDKLSFDDVRNPSCLNATFDISFQQNFIKIALHYIKCTLSFRFFSLWRSLFSTSLLHWQFMVFLHRVSWNQGSTLTWLINVRSLLWAGFNPGCIFWCQTFTFHIIITQI